MKFTQITCAAATVAAIAFGSDTKRLLESDAFAQAILAAEVVGRQ